MKYYYGNFDENRRGLILAENAKEASKLIGLSEAKFSQDWEAFQPEHHTFVNAYKRSVVYTKPRLGPKKPWQEGICPLN